MAEIDEDFSSGALHPGKTTFIIAVLGCLMPVSIFCCLAFQVPLSQGPVRYLLGEHM